MLILLPPSETKHPGGSPRPLDLDALAFPRLRPQREEVVAALVELSRDAEVAARVLRLSDRQRGEIAANASLTHAPTMPAIDRYAGVLYDALDAGSLDAAARRWLGTHVLIQSAPFGPVAAADRIPSYRLQAGTAVPALAPLRRLWASAVTAEFERAPRRFVLDLRSEAYVALGPVPSSTDSVYLRVVTETGDGVTRALNHFNKHAKGELVRSLASTRPRVGSAAAFRDWAAGAGWRIDAVNGRESLLYVAASS